MAERTGIAWADHTFNAWWGCEKVGPECAHCYAEEFAGRFPASRGLWGPNAPRKVATERYWRQPLAWNKKAAKAGLRRRVFVNSMSDVLEDRRALDALRERLWGLVAECTSLDWLLLTKRPQNFERLTPRSWWSEGGWPANVWAGTTVGDQERAGERVPPLLRVPAPVRFLSLEPLLGAVDLCRVQITPDGFADVLRGLRWFTDPNGGMWEPKGDDAGVKVQWVIVGGESGDKARPMHPDWALTVRDDCRREGVPFFFKQWGEWTPIVACYPDADETDEDGCEIDVPGECSRFEDVDQVALEPGGSVPQWIDADGSNGCDHQPRAGSWWMARVGTKKSGARLDEREWAEVPR